jgi:Abnormal spindle-like microcephaly-assoc'd, ASPM-SPD-2-Hydin
MRPPRFRVIFPLLVTLVFAAVALLHFSVSAQRVGHDLPSSKNGTTDQNDPAATCVGDLNIRPFAAVLNGAITSNTNCSKQSSNPTVYQNFSVSLSSSTPPFTVTITPVLWQDNGTSIAASKQTILHLAFSSSQTNPALMLRSFVIGKALSGADYLVYDLNESTSQQPLFTKFSLTTVEGLGLQTPLFSVDNTADSAIDNDAIEPTPITFADMTTTRWDFSQSSPVIPGTTVDLVVSGFPTDFDSLTKNPNDNGLTQAFFTSSNFLVVIEDSNGATYSVGGLSIPNITTPPTNDSIANAIVIPPTMVQSSGFTAQINASSATPQQDATGNLIHPDPSDPLLPSTSTCIQNFPEYTKGALLRTVWFSYAPTTGGAISISTANSRYDTVLEVFAGTPQNLTLQACDDNYPNPSPVQQQAMLPSVAVTGGQIYYIMVGESPTEQGLDTNGDSMASPLSNDATLFFSVTPALPTASVTPAKLTFPAEAIGVVSAPKKVTLTNASTNGSTLDALTFFLNGANASDFVMSSNTCPITLSPAAKCTIGVTFSPTSFGKRAATLNIMDNATNSPQTVALSGTGPDFDISISPTSATVSQGQATSATVTLTPVNGFNQTIAVTCAAPPSSTCSAAPVTLDGVHAATTIVTITTSTKTPKNTYNTNVFGTSGTDKHSTRIVLTVD